MNMFARFDENPAMTLQDIKETKRYGPTDGQRENSIPTTNKICGGYNYMYLDVICVVKQTTTYKWLQKHYMLNIRIDILRSLA